MKKEMSDISTKLSVQKSRVDAARAQGDKAVADKEALIQQLNQTIADKKKSYGENLDALAADIKMIEKERDEYRKKVIVMEGRRPGGRTTTGSDVASAELRNAFLQISLLEDSLRYAHHRLAEAQGKSVKDALTRLPSLAPRKAKSDALIKSIKTLRTAETLGKNMLQTLAGIKVVDVSKSSAQTTDKNLLASTQLANNTAKLMRMTKEGERTAASLNSALIACFPSQADGKGATAVQADYARLVNERASSNVIGRISIPKAIVCHQNKIRLGPEEFRQLHAAFA